MRLPNMCQEIRMCPAPSNSTVIGLKTLLAFKRYGEILHGLNEIVRKQTSLNSLRVEWLIKELSSLRSQLE